MLVVTNKPETPTEPVSRQALVPRLRLVVVTPNMQSYSGAFYQNDFLVALARQSECVFFGPGYRDFGTSDKELSQKLADFEPDAVLFSHAFLSDSLNSNIQQFPFPRKVFTSIPKFGFLNKEYSRLDQKLQWFEDQSISMIFSHHHNVHDLSKLYGFATKHVPFGVSLDRFKMGPKRKSHDIGFTGIQKNPTFPSAQDDMRVQFQKQLFWSAFGYPLVRKPTRTDYSVIWRTWKGHHIPDRLATLFLQQGPVTVGQYQQLLRNTRIWLNFLSPMGLVGTRFLESMASGAVVLTPYNEEIKRLFSSGTFLFVQDPFAIRDEIESYLDQPELLEQISSKAREETEMKHTWDKRVSDMLGFMTKSLSTH